jgi:hypothetical protein
MSAPSFGVWFLFRQLHCAQCVGGGAMDQDWNKAERLAVAAAVAPSLRSQDDKTKQRRVALVDASGKVTGYTTLGEVQKSLLKARAIELEVADGVRPKEVLCRACGKTVKVPKGGFVPTVCREGCARECNDCGKSLPSDTLRRAARAGRTPRCLICSSAAKTPEQRSEAGRRRCAMTPEQRSEIARRRNAAMTPEQRSEIARRANAAKTPEQRSEIARRANAAKTPEQRSEIARRRSAAMTPEQRSDAARKASETRRANKAAAEAAK